jgi:hypothetical protein
MYSMYISTVSLVHLRDGPRQPARLQLLGGKGGLGELLLDAHSPAGGNLVMPAFDFVLAALSAFWCLVCAKTG